jgi:uncharacterized phage protein (TIGR02218 family)
MAYDDYEASANLGSRIFLYLFEMGGIETWAYTRAKHEVTVDGVTYVPAVISHDEQSADTGDGSQTEQKIEVAFDNPVALIHVPYLPPKPVQVTIMSVQRNDISGEVKTHFYGEINSFQQKGVTAELRCSQGNDPTQRLIPRANHGGGCRHVTYSDACALDREDWKTVISDLSLVDGFTLQSPTFLSLGTGWLQRGYAENPATGETRYITSHVGNTIMLVYPFTGLTAADEIWVYAGDDKKAETCRIKFNNKPQYLGFDFFPSFNVFADGVRKGNGDCGPGNGDRIPVPTFDELILSTNPRAFYKLDDVATGIMTDSSPYANHGTYSAGPGDTVSGGAPIFGAPSGAGSMQLGDLMTGTSNGGGIAGPTVDHDISDGGNYAIACAFYLDSFADFGVKRFVSSYGAVAQGWHNFNHECRGGPNHEYLFSSFTKTNTDLAPVQANAGVVCNVPYWFVVRKDATGMRIYLNNQKVAEQTAGAYSQVGTNLSWINGALQVGFDPYFHDASWFGRLQNVVLWANNCPSELVFTKIYNKLTVSDP